MIRSSHQTLEKYYKDLDSNKENKMEILDTISITSASPKKITAGKKPLETNEKKLQTRQRQLDIGKQTDGYTTYIKEVRRKDRTNDHPRTPDKYIACSTRSWQGSVRVWRRKLHYWDPPAVTTQLSKSNKEDHLSGDSVSEEGNQGNSEEVAMDQNIDDDQPLTESMLFWSRI